MIISKKSLSIRGIITLPTSKSLSNRALILKEVSQKKLSIKNLSQAEDTTKLNAILNNLNSSEEEIFNIETDNCGTCIRFLTSFLSIRQGQFILTGNKRMQQRPIGPLVQALRSLGAKISYIFNDGYVPLFIRGSYIEGGRVEIDCSISSQFASSLVLIAPILNKGLHLFVKNLHSASYLDMTFNFMRQLGLKINKISEFEYFIPHQQFQLQIYTIPKDWSSASFWYAIFALTKEGSIILKDLKKCDLQGDSITAKIYKELGVNTEFNEQGTELTHSQIKTDFFEKNLNNYPDLAIPLIVNLILLGISFKITGLSHLKYKESNRLKCLQTELKKIGANLLINSNGSVSWQKEKLFFPEKILFNTYADHRIAMALSQIALFTNIELNNAQRVVKKSYPSFWENFNKIFTKSKTQ